MSFFFFVPFVVFLSRLSFFLSRMSVFFVPFAFFLSPACMFVLSRFRFLCPGAFFFVPLPPHDLSWSQPMPVAGRDVATGLVHKSSQQCRGDRVE